MTKNRFVVYPLLSTLVLSGCVSPQLAHDTKDFIGNQTSSVDELKQDMIGRTDNSREARRKSAFVNHPYLAGKSVALSPTANLPLALQKGVKVKLVFPKNRVNLAVAAEQITLATKINVVISPDMYLPQGALLPRAQKLEGESGSSSAVPIPSAAPVGQGNIAAGPLPALSSVTGGNSGGLVSAGYAGPDTAQEVEITQDEMPLNQVLDLMTTRLGGNWEYDAKKGVIRVYRMVTKTWLLPIRPSSMSYSTDFQNGTQQSNNQNALQNTQQDKAAARSEANSVSEITSILNDVQTVMTRSGSVAGNVSQGTVTITDTKDAVERAESIINFHRALLSKMVAIHMRLVQITLNDQGQLGVDWQAVLTKALNKVPGFVLTSTSPVSLVASTAGSLTAKITSGQFSGTQAAVTALADLGNTASSDDIPIEVQNRHTQYYNNRVRFSYVADTTPATATAGGTGGVPGLTTAQDQVGLKMMVYASVTDNNSVAVTVALDSSVLQNIEPFTSGAGTNQQTVQLVNTTGQGVSTDAIIRNGATTVLTVFDSNSAQYDKRTLGHNIPIIAGGSVTASRTRTATLLVMSATIKDTGAGPGAPL